MMGWVMGNLVFLLGRHIDLDLFTRSFIKGPEDDDPRNMTASMLHTTGTPHQTMMQPQSEFSLKFLPPSRSESERELRQLIDQCVEEKEQVETGELSSLCGQHWPKLIYVYILTYLHTYILH